MKINARNFGIAAASTIAIAYTALGLLLKYRPIQTLKFIGTIHMMPKLDLIKSFIKVTPQAIAMGIMTHTIASFLIFWLIATIYNKIQELFKK